ncbi:MAG TPA: cation:proton antiporter [Candidatus Diapherotrites archaeon]|uniref:Cation:proton antiporter n=1 Tax=Candidatus Iainarchaeum sp. TaxID=3101447 RepID=A0A7J4IYD2_9ARCH|nr:cation:proton antiporter [Candidatus Diapherotrites archaeon]
MVEALPLTTIGIIIVIAILVSIIVKKFGQNPVLGYIIAGFLLGPFLLKFLHPTDPLVVGFSEMGLFILLFYLGLELSLKDFLAAGTTSFFLAIIDILLSVAVGFAISYAFGFSLMFSLIIGLMLFCTSTAIVAKFALDNKIMGLPSTQISISILILQDFLGIILLVFVTSFSKSGEAIDLAISAVMFAAAAFFVVYQLGQWVEDWLTKNSFGHIEITLFSLGIGLVVATLASVLHLSTALGAYFAGFALAETEAGRRIKHDIHFLRDFFLVFFFVSFGTTIFFSHEAGTVVIPSPDVLATMLGLAILLIIGGTMAHGIVFSLFGPLFGLRRGEDTSRAAILLGPLGEFVVIIATSAVVMLGQKEALLLPTISFMVIAVSVILFQPMYSKMAGHVKLFGMLPRIFSTREHSTVAAHNDESMEHFKRFAINMFVVLAIAWVAVLLYYNLPRLGIPIIYSRQATTAIIFAVFAALPFFRAMKAARHILRALHIRKIPRAV